MLSKNYAAHVHFHLTYENIPNGKVITNQLPKRIEFLINASGFDLLTFRLKSTNNPISIDVNDNMDERNRMAKNIYRVSTRSLLSEFTEQLKRDVNIQSIVPDSIEFNFSTLLSRKVPVKSNVKVNFEKQFDATGNFSLMPDSIVVSGPLSYLETLHEVETADTTFDNVKNNLNQIVRLKSNNSLSSETRSVRFIVPVEKYTEGSMEIPLQVINAKSNQRLKIFPDKVTVSYLVALSNYEKVTTHQFNAIVDAGQIGHGSTKLDVQLKKNPDFVKNAIIKPGKVEYLILK